MPNHITRACPDPVQRFWQKVNRDGPVPAHQPHLGNCWVWTGFHDVWGYGLAYLNGKGEVASWGHRAHRIAYELEVGPIPAGMLACHRCDNPLCVRPSHIFLGTNLDNCRDKFAKGRQADVRGEGNPRSKLSEQDVRDIRYARANGGKVEDLAARYHVTPTLISMIGRRKIWTHLRD